MTDDALLDAVDELTLERKITTIIKDDDTEAWIGVHTETHPPLITLLLEGTGITRGAKSAAIRIPIDADALEMWGQIRDIIKLWCKQLGADFDGDDLLGSIRKWYVAHSNAYRAGTFRETIDRDVTRMVQGWVRMIQGKFDPPEKREWTSPCPEWVANEPGNPQSTFRRCGARKVLANGEERFAIQLNVTTMTAECSACGAQWAGLERIKQLRYDTNVWGLQEDGGVDDTRVTKIA